MSNIKKRSNLPECGCRGCNLKTDRPRKNFAMLNEAKDKNSLRTSVRTGLQCSSVECSCECNGENVSNLHGIGETFIRFTGPTSASSVNPAECVIASNSNLRSTSGCFLEKSSDGKSRAFDLDSNVVSEKAPDKYFRSVTIWQGVLNKTLSVRTRRSSGLHVAAAARADRSLPSNYNFCNGNSQEDGKKRLPKRTFHLRAEVDTQRYYQNLTAALFFI